MAPVRSLRFVSRLKKAVQQGGGETVIDVA
jgi:hypothetical protein